MIGFQQYARCQPHFLLRSLRTLVENKLLVYASVTHGRSVAAVASVSSIYSHGLGQRRCIVSLSFPQEIPVLTPKILVKESTLSASNYPVVVFDVETAGGEFHTSIIQLAAAGPCRHFFKDADGDALDSVGKPDTDANECIETFSRYVFPTTHMSFFSSKVHGIYLSRQNELVRHGKVLPMESISAVLKDFTDWLKKISQGRPVILAAHNCHQLDMRSIVNAYKSVDMLPELHTHVAGFLDTLPPFKNGSFYSGGGVGLGAIHEHCVGNGAFDSHDAASDVQALVDVIAHVPMHAPTLDLSTALGYVEYRRSAVNRLETYRGALAAKAVKIGIAMRLSDKGIAYGDLMQMHIFDPEDGVQRFFAAPVKANGNPRITNVKRVARTLADFLTRDMFSYAKKQAGKHWTCFASFEAPVRTADISSRQAFFLACCFIDSNQYCKIKSESDGTRILDEKCQHALDLNQSYVDAVEDGRWTDPDADHSDESESCEDG